MSVVVSVLTYLVHNSASSGFPSGVQRTGAGSSRLTMSDILSPVDGCFSHELLPFFFGVPESPLLNWLAVNGDCDGMADEMGNAGSQSQSLTLSVDSSQGDADDEEEEEEEDDTW